MKAGSLSWPAGKNTENCPFLTFFVPQKTFDRWYSIRYQERRKRLVRSRLRLRAIFVPPHIEGLRSCVAYFVGVSGLFLCEKLKRMW